MRLEVESWTAFDVGYLVPEFGNIVVSAEVTDVPCDSGYRM